MAAPAALRRRQRRHAVDVVAHYNRVRKLDLTAEQQRELIEYLKVL
ncbi:MAG TPA: hypothetical protein VMO26_18045 [Vicinamibacterales bacterium]|nr:hypothetical protein [Vicinamibacterales bacterium]